MRYNLSNSTNTIRLIAANGCIASVIFYNVSVRMHGRTAHRCYKTILSSMFIFHVCPGICPYTHCYYYLCAHSQLQTPSTSLDFLNFLFLYPQFFYLASTWWPGARCTLRRSHAQKSLVTERYLFRPLKNSTNEK